MVLIARYGEIFLKGSNRADFERKLADNIQKMFGVKVWRKRNRLLVEEGEGVNLRRVFGLISYSPAVETEMGLEEIKETVLKIVAGKEFSSFAVAAKRMGADFLSSKEINEELGKFVLERTGKRVDLRKPDLVIGVEIIDNKAYVFTETVECFGGLPVGIEGKVGLLVEDENSLLAGLLVMKRGCGVIPVSLAGKDISLLQKFNPKKLILKRVNSIKEAEEEKDLPALAVGKELKNQTKLTVINPLVGLSDDEIRKKISIFKNVR